MAFSCLAGSGRGVPAVEDRLPGGGIRPAEVE
jgi:hypothetical protein